MQGNTVQTKSSTQGATVYTPQSVPVTSKELYFCMDEVFSEPRETLRYPIAIRADYTDENLCKLTNQALDKARGNPLKGWLLNRLLWKRCVGIDFREVCYYA